LEGEGLSEHRLITPLGDLTLDIEGEFVSRIELAKEQSFGTAPPGQVRTYFVRYFQGKDPGRFPLGIELDGATEFQRDVYDALMKVPFGGIISYSELSVLSGHPGASRAVGNAVGKNPLIIVIPCHRVVGRLRDGYYLGGFSSGLDVKRSLLRNEGQCQGIAGL
jgi:O-6-methylguanine DNA methyltransferase